MYFHISIYSISSNTDVVKIYFSVDGLETCNKQVVRSRSAFAFGEGIPFSATLWSGSEGFHMSVNGRHETSFAYRPKLEAWSVTRVRASAGLKLLSVLAKDLPVSEDHDMVVDAQTLKAPPLKRKRVVMLVGVFSTGNNFERRMALRRSWMQYEAVRSGDVAVRFFIGLVSLSLSFRVSFFFFPS